jgi:hypothetical protein
MRLNWGAVAIGGIAGIGSAVVLAVPIRLLAGTSGFGPLALLILVGFAGQMIGGYVAGRFAGTEQAAHGGLAALLSYLVTAAIAIATGQEPPITTLVFSGVVALVLGSAGGVLAAAHQRRA